MSEAPLYQCIREKEIDGVLADSKTHVTFTMFWAVVILLVGLFGAMLGVVYANAGSHEKDDLDFQKDITSQVNNTNLAQTRIEERLTNIQSDVQSIKKLIANIK